MRYFTSSSNPRIRELQRLQTSRARKQSGLFLMEGPHLLQALLDAHVLPHEVYYQPALLSRTSKGKLLLDRLLHTPALTQDRLIEVSERVIEVLGEVQTSQGLVSVLPMAAFTLAQVHMRRLPTARPILLILDGLADPGNMGTILRTALAADVALVLLTATCVDYYSPKVVRAAAGAHITLPVETNVAWATLSQRVTAHCLQSPRVLLAETGSSHMYYDEEFTRPFALIIGNEAHGPSHEARALATCTVSIPLAHGVESLNAAMAAGIILYEAVRQAAVGPKL